MIDLLSVPDAEISSHIALPEEQGHSEDERMFSRDEVVPSAQAHTSPKLFVVWTSWVNLHVRPPSDQPSWV